MKFSKFVTDVQGWQRDKGIYEHSTPLAQALKAVSEVGELADAVIKGIRDGIKDGIGDVMVCLVGVATMLPEVFDFEALNPTADSEYEWAYWNKYTTVQGAVAAAAAQVSEVAVQLALGFHPLEALRASAAALSRVAMLSGMSFEDCCEAAWLEIKDRKGRMVEGGAFVKDEAPADAPQPVDSPTLRDQFAMAEQPAEYEGYERLQAVFDAAMKQAAEGKGKERHANNLPFHDQRMQRISTLLDSPDGMAYQTIKKVTEGLQFTCPERREAELLGAIVYLAGIVVWLRRRGNLAEAAGAAAIRQVWLRHVGNLL